jgi:hypothetical protein
MSDDCVFTKCAWRLREAHWSTHGGQFMAVTFPTVNCWAIRTLPRVPTRTRTDTPSPQAFPSLNSSREGKPLSLTVALFPLPRTERKNIARAHGRFSAHNPSRNSEFP